MCTQEVVLEEQQGLQRPVGSASVCGNWDGHPLVLGVGTVR